MVFEFLEVGVGKEGGEEEEILNYFSQYFLIF